MEFACAVLFACGPCIFLSIAEVHVGKPCPGVTGTKGGGSALPEARRGRGGECGFRSTYPGRHLHLPLAPGTLRSAVWPTSVVQHRCGAQFRPETQFKLQQSTGE